MSDIRVYRYVFDNELQAFALGFLSETFEIKPEVLNTLTDRPESDILRLYMHHSDESQGHPLGPWGLMALEIKQDIIYLLDMQRFQAQSIGALAIAYNYFVTQDGIVWCCRPPEKIPASQLGDNQHGLSVCFDGDFTSHGLNDTQKSVGKLLFKFLAEKYHIKKENVLGHRDVAVMHPNNPGYFATECPGDYFYAHDFIEIRDACGSTS